MSTAIDSKLWSWGVRALTGWSRTNVDAQGVHHRTPDQKALADVVSPLLTSAWWTTESLHYLAHLDAQRFAGAWPADGFDNAMVDEAHARWATGSAITALDLCAAALGRVHGLAIKGGHELDLRDIKDPKKPDRLARLPPHWQKWVRDVNADPDYQQVLAGRNPLTHSTTPRTITAIMGSSAVFAGHELRPAHQLAGVGDVVRRATAGTHGGRKLVEIARDVATQYVRALLLMAIEHWFPNEMSKVVAAGRLTRDIYDQMVEIAHLVEPDRPGLVNLILPLEPK